ncbi:hypothetical protein D3C86_858930 [compost metagenome]
MDIAKPKLMPARTCVTSQRTIDDSDDQSTENTLIKAKPPPKVSAIHPAVFQNPKPERYAARTERSVGW